VPVVLVVVPVVLVLLLGYGSGLASPASSSQPAAPNARLAAASAIEKE
jgi:hypothetical protein